MHRQDLLQLLQNYHPKDENERKMVLETQVFVQQNSLCFERSLPSGHVTASAWVISPDLQQVLLMHHKKLDRWFQPGGHCDGDPDVRRVALKETEEETGAFGQLVGNEIFDVDVHLIPANAKEAAHFHYDIRFLVVADPATKPAANAESKEVRWVSMSDVPYYNSSESILRMQRKILASV
ncbi:NUDIX hydrolase [Arundinibacter roseus]|uniref:NUDIX domain-containing protein n=1 Tax=Arundinibacter roseus TaxID=2070510 RepID=A0A4R4KJ02_9BACT|nr:NUDIX hydrolase [Arundinibacter roseus]TDB68250.1 NUDIX domain-containing protein [Arundinibacter roseus]